MIHENETSEQKLGRLWLEFEKGGLKTWGRDRAFKKALELDFKEYAGAALEAKTDITRGNK